MDAKGASMICKALGDATRIRIVELLTGGELCACHLLEHFQISQPTLSHHMHVLEECGLVRARKEWKYTYYSLDCGTLTAFRGYIDHVRCDSSGSQKVDGSCRCCGAKDET